MHLENVDKYLRGVAFSFTSLAARIIEERRALARRDHGLRPWLVLWSCTANGGDDRDALPVAAAFDLFDRFIVLHRELATEPVQTSPWGLGQNLNGGDALCAVAFRTLTSDVRDSARRLAAAKVVGEAVLEAIERSDEVAENAALTGAALQGGAIIGGAGAEVAQIFARAGRTLGTAVAAANSTRSQALLSESLAQIRSVITADAAQAFEEVASCVAQRAA
ncbi:MAG: hypothetical protein JO263_10485 [Candidatus Eremiobacteraeota bacterium]|nr:hypothetical protein [Candidatus Eremiobacteraeota bacterium]